MLKKRILAKKTISFVAFIIPVLDFILDKLYSIYTLNDLRWVTNLTTTLWVLLPFSAGYFLFQKEMYQKLYGCLILLYILSLLYRFLYETNGAI